ASRADRPAGRVPVRPGRRHGGPDRHHRRRPHAPGPRRLRLPPGARGGRARRAAGPGVKRCAREVLTMEGVTRVVLDTNVLVAAASTPASASRRVVETCLAGERTAVLSPALRREYEFILGRAVRGQPYRERLQQLLNQADVVVPGATPRVVPEDPDDDKL